MYRNYIKRIFDIIISLLGIIIFSPVFVVLAILIKIKLGSPVIFKQERIGQNNKIFLMYKFRSMTNEKDQNGNLLPDEIRLTPFGAALRKTSLDELPELYNILKGEMSLIGPRPCLVQDYVFMNKNHKKRHIERPGLTGLAQVNGRNALSWDDKIRFDIGYNDHLTWLLDLKIFIKTFGVILSRENISSEGMATAETLSQFLRRVENISDELYHDKLKYANILILRFREKK